MVRRAEVDGQVADLVLDGEGGELDAAGGAVIPGLWDHHIHLLALAAARRSVDVRAGLETLRAATPAPGGWLRAVGYHETTAGAVDRWALDAFVPDRPLRVQHRSGALWVLNSAAVEALDLGPVDRPSIERDGAGTPTGRIYGDDAWLRERLGGETPDLRPIGAELASYGVTGVTDATPFADPADVAAIDGLAQRVVVMGGPELTGDGALRGAPVKLVLADHALPPFADVVSWIGAAADAGRPVAIHSVTRASLALAVAALHEAGAASGTRIEHGSVVPPELRRELARLGVTVVTQPNFVAERGDQYVVDVDADDVPHLYPCASLVAAGIPVAAGTDAPFGDPDPWRAISAAVRRTTQSGAVLGAGEALAPRAALDLFLGPPEAPGSTPRRVVAGTADDLCVLDAPLAAVLAEPDSARVRATVVAGRVVYSR